MLQKSSSKAVPKTTFIFLISILIAATLMRFYRLGEGLWLDEITTYLRYATLPFGKIVTSFESENQHFLYSLMAHASFLLFGESAWALRLPAVIFGIASILALFSFGTEVTNRLEALLATALMAFSYHHIWFSQNARGYTGLLFWTLISSWMLFRGMRLRRVTNWILYATSAALGVYTHLTMGFIILGQFIVFILAWIIRKENKEPAYWKGLIYGFLLAGLIILALHMPVLKQMSSIIGGSQESVVAEWKSPIWTVMEILRGLEIGLSTSIVGLLALGMFGVGLWSYWKSYPEFILLLLIPPFTGAVITIAIGHHLWPRFFFFAFGFGVLVVIRGVMRFGDWMGRALHLPNRRIAWVGVVLCLILIAVSATSVRWSYGPKQDYEAALTYIENNRQAGDAITTVGIASVVYDEFYQVNWEHLSTLDQLDRLRAGAERTWIIYTFPEVLDATNPEIMEIIQNDFMLIAEYPGTVKSGTVYVVRAD